MNSPDTQENDYVKSQPPLAENSSFGRDVITCLAFLSRLPIKSSDQPYSLAHASRAFGVSGLVLGALAGVVFQIANIAGFSSLIAVIVALALSALITGGLHEDGLADVADGFGGGWTIDRKLEIMRDSQIGTYGVLALVFSVAFRIAAYAGIIDGLGNGAGVSGSGTSFMAAIGLFAAIGCLSRAPMAVMMYQMSLARSDGRAAQAGVPSHNNVRNGLFISVIAGSLCLLMAVPIGALIAVLASIAIAYLIIGKLAKKHIGGYTGDVLGTLQQTAEIFALLALLAFN